MLKSKHVFALGSFRHVNLYTEDLVIAHAHQIPSGIQRLNIVRSIPGATPYFLAPDQVGDLYLESPPNPAPIHTVIVRLFLSVNLSQFPVKSSIC
jgi:hypothetical protein